METGTRVLLMTTAFLTLPGCASVSSWYHHREDVREAEEEARRQEAAQNNGLPPDDNAAPPRVIEPEVERQHRRIPRIKASDLEFGLNYGALSIEDFGVNPVYSANLAFHVTEDFFLRAEVGRSNGGTTSFEAISKIPLLSNAQRRFTYYDLSLGYNFLPGEAFLGKGTAITSDFYLTGGIGGTDFGGNTNFTVNFGGGYQVLPSDWLAVHIEVQDHVFQSTLLGTSKLTNNLEARIGTSVYF